MTKGAAIGGDGFLRAAAGKALAETPEVRTSAAQSEMVLRAILEHRGHILESIAHVVQERIDDPELRAQLRATVSTPGLEATLSLDARKNEVEIWILELPTSPWLRSNVEAATKDDFALLQRGLVATVDKLGEELTSAFGARPKSIAGTSSAIVVRFVVPGLKEALESAGSHRAA